MFKGYLIILNDLATPKLLNIMKVNCHYHRISLYILFIPNKIRNYISLPHIYGPIAVQLRISSLSYKVQAKNILSILTYYCWSRTQVGHNPARSQSSPILSFVKL